MDVREYDAMQESLAMVKMLAVSTREVKEGKIRDADDVFADMEVKLAAKRHVDEILRKRLLREDVPDGAAFDK